MSKPVIQFVAADDWMACYVDGALIDQGHSLYVIHLLEMISDRLGFIMNDTVYYGDDQMDLLGCNFPDRLEDIDGQL